MSSSLQLLGCLHASSVILLALHLSPSPCSLQLSLKPSLLRACRSYHVATLRFLLAFSASSLSKLLHVLRETQRLFLRPTALSGTSFIFALCCGQVIISHAPLSQNFTLSVSFAANLSVSHVLAPFLDFPLLTCCYLPVLLFTIPLPPCFFLLFPSP